MILTLLACLYITALCWSWGFLLCIWIQKITGEQEPLNEGLIITCLGGLAMIGVTFCLLSLAMPLGEIGAHAALALPAIACWYMNRDARTVFAAHCRDAFRALRPPVILLLAIAVTGILVMSVAVIRHPDTLIYHAQCIYWIESYKVIPGLVNLTYHYGLQSSWFVLSALFSFRFTGTEGLTFLNSTVMIWYLIFVLVKVNHCLSGTPATNTRLWKGTLWLTLLVFSLWSYTQVRLTATSASPDFIATIFIWLVFLLFFTSVQATPALSRLLLLLVFGFFAITVKLSALPAVLLPVYAYYRYRDKRTPAALLLPLIPAIIILAPFIARNVITSGYPLFPSPFPDVIRADWKAPLSLLVEEKQYITAYARVGGQADPRNAPRVLQLTLSEWIPVWWHNRSVADKTIMAALITLLSITLLLAKKINWKHNGPYVAGLLFSLAGVAYWFILAPDLRFGSGFIIPLQAILLYFLAGYYHPAAFAPGKKQLSYLLFAVIAVTGAYTVYRAANYFSVNNLVRPAGVFRNAYARVRCHGILVNIPEKGGCGSTPLPCVPNGCSHFSLRGNRITDGFAPAAPGGK